VQDVVLMGDSRVAGIPVRDEGERLVDLAEAGFRVDGRCADPEGAYRLLREGAAERLARAEKLLPRGLRLLVVEGYRPLELQRRYFEEYRDELAKLHPDYSPDQLRTAASRYVSPPELAPHSAGAAIDLTLCEADGAELDMGTRMNASPEESEGRCYTDAPGLDPRAAENRAILVEAMHSAGFVNYPTEWWHFSYGDRYWALLTKRQSALYGVTTAEPR
jgi:D-alanyl-D-alanine dipeptidase